MMTRIVFMSIITLAVGGCADSSRLSNPDDTRATTKSKKNADGKDRAVVAVDHEFHGPREVIAAGSLTVDVMQLMFPQRTFELTQRMQQASRRNPQWWLEHVKKAKPGEPLPYDSRLGLSEEEYNEFLRPDKKPILRKKTEAILSISSKDGHVFVLDGGNSLPDLTGIEIDLQRDLVRTPFGVTKGQEEFHATEDSVLGPWDGVRWKLNDFDIDNMKGAIVTFTVGKMKLSNRCVLDYDVKKISPAGKIRISHILTYDLPAKK